MALTFRLTSIKDHKTVCHDEDGLKTETRALIWSSISVGFSRLTDSNLEDWLFRLNLLFDSDVQFLTEDGDPVKVERAMLEDHVGLRTNAAPLSKTKFLSHVVKIRKSQQEQTRLAAARS